MGQGEIPDTMPESSEEAVPRRPIPPEVQNASDAADRARNEFGLASQQERREVPDPKPQDLLPAAASPANFIPVKLQSFKEALQFGDIMVKTGLLPWAVKTGPQAVLIMLTGQELGIPPMKALRMIHVIEGKPSLSAELQLGLWRKNGGHAKQLSRGPDEVVWWFRHPNGDEHTETFTWAEAQTITFDSWEGPKGQRNKVSKSLVDKSNWRNYPTDMMSWRCVTRGLRAIGGDLLGTLYDPDELGAVTGPSGEVVQVPEPEVLETSQVETEQGIPPPWNVRMEPISQEPQAVTQPSGYEVGPRPPQPPPQPDQFPPPQPQPPPQRPPPPQAQPVAPPGPLQAMPNSIIGVHNAAVVDLWGSQWGYGPTKNDARDNNGALVTCPGCYGPTWDNRILKDGSVRTRGKTFKCKGVYSQGKWVHSPCREIDAATGTEVIRGWWIGQWEKEGSLYQPQAARTAAEPQRLGEHLEGAVPGLPPLSPPPQPQQPQPGYTPPMPKSFMTPGQPPVEETRPAQGGGYPPPHGGPYTDDQQ